MKRIILILFSLIVLLSANAQEHKYLNIVLKNNSCVSYEIESNTAYIVFNDSCMIINNMDFYLENVVKYYVSNEDNSISNIKNAHQSKNKILGNNLYINTTQKGFLNLYDISGKCIFTRYITKQDMVIDLSSLPKGVYIVRINKESFKFNKR